MYSFLTWILPYLVVSSRMHSYVTRMYSYVLVCTRMYSYVLVCTRMYSYVFVCTRMLLECTRVVF